MAELIRQVGPDPTTALSFLMRPAEERRAEEDLRKARAAAEALGVRAADNPRRRARARHRAKGRRRRRQRRHDEWHAWNEQEPYRSGDDDSHSDASLDSRMGDGSGPRSPIFDGENLYDEDDDVLIGDVSDSGSEHDSGLDLEPDINPWLRRGRIGARAEGSHLKQGTIFVGGLSHETTAESLKTHCEANFGRVRKAVVKYAQNGQPRGFGFVTFESVDSTLLACAEHYSMLDGKRVELKSHEKSDEDCVRLRAAIDRRFEQMGTEHMHWQVPMEEDSIPNPWEYRKRWRELADAEQVQQEIDELVASKGFTIAKNRVVRPKAIDTTDARVSWDAALPTAPYTEAEQKKTTSRKERKRERREARQAGVKGQPANRKPGRGSQKRQDGEKGFGRPKDSDEDLDNSA